MRMRISGGKERCCLAAAIGVNGAGMLGLGGDSSGASIKLIVYRETEKKNKVTSGSCV